MSSTSAVSDTCTGLFGSVYVRMLWTPRGPNTCSRSGEANQCARSFDIVVGDNPWHDGLLGSCTRRSDAGASVPRGATPQMTSSWKAITNAPPEQRTGLSSDDVLRVLARGMRRNLVDRTQGFRGFTIFQQERHPWLSGTDAP